MEDPSSDRRSSGWVRAPYAAHVPGNPHRRVDNVVAVVSDLADSAPIGFADRGASAAVSLVGDAVDGLHSDARRDTKPRQVMLTTALETLSENLTARRAAAKEAEAELERTEAAAGAARSVVADLTREGRSPPPSPAALKAAMSTLRVAATAQADAKKHLTFITKTVAEATGDIKRTRQLLAEATRTEQRPLQRTAAVQRDVAQRRIALGADGQMVPRGVPGHPALARSPWMKIHPTIVNQIRMAFNFVKTQVIPRCRGVDITLEQLLTSEELSGAFGDLVQTYITQVRNASGSVTRWAADSRTTKIDKARVEFAMVRAASSNPRLF
jgi:hypothetical protein